MEHEHDKLKESLRYLQREVLVLAKDSTAAYKKSHLTHNKSES